MCVCLFALNWIKSTDVPYGCARLLVSLAVTHPVSDHAESYNQASYATSGSTI